MIVLDDLTDLVDRKDCLLAFDVSRCDLIVKRPLGKYASERTSPTVFYRLKLNTGD